MQLKKHKKTNSRPNWAVWTVFVNCAHWRGSTLATYKTILIIFPLNLQTITITLDVVKWRWGGWRLTTICLWCCWCCTDSWTDVKTVILTSSGQCHKIQSQSTWDSPGTHSTPVSGTCVSNRQVYHGSVQSQLVPSKVLTGRTSGTIKYMIKRKDQTTDLDLMALSAHNRLHCAFKNYVEVKTEINE